MLIFASISARMLYRLIVFLPSLKCQTKKNTWERNQSRGKARGSATSRFKEIMSSGLQFGTTLWVKSRTQLLTSELWLQARKVWTQSSLKPEEHKVHTELSLCPRWCSLEPVGRMLCNSLNKKLVWSELRLLRCASSQLLSQVTLGWVISHFTGFQTCLWPASNSMVILFSINTKYHCLVDIVAMFNKPSCTTCLIAE